MIDTLGIKWFKSIKNIQLECKRINLFIGEPNTGKSNILEALGFLNWCADIQDIRKFVRLEQPQNLFYDNLVEKDKFQIFVGGLREAQIRMNLLDNQYHIYDVAQPNTKRTMDQTFNLYDDDPPQVGFPSEKLKFIKYFKFKQMDIFPNRSPESLIPPHGENLGSVILSSTKLRKLAGDFFTTYGLSLVIRSSDNRMELQKLSDGIAITYPYHLASDTLQRMIYYAIAMETHSQSTLVFEEPESHAFPYYTKYLGERIALDQYNNQYFIATHNPYLLTSILEKSPKEDVAVYAVFYENYETKIKRLSEDDLNVLFEGDPFLSLELVIGK